jgi:hypothetical protein
MVEWVKEHPYLAGATVVGLLVLIIIWRNSAASSAASATPTTSPGYYGPSDALQTASMAYGVQALQAQLGANTQTQSDQTAVQLAAIQAETQLAGINATRETTDTQTAAGLTLGLANIAAPLALNGATAQLTQTPTGLIFGALQNAQQQTQKQQQQQAAVTTAANVPVTPAALIPQPNTLGASPLMPGSNYITESDVAAAAGVSYIKPTAASSVIYYSNYVPGTTPTQLNSNLGPDGTPVECPAGMHALNGVCLNDMPANFNSLSVQQQYALVSANTTLQNAAAVAAYNAAHNG